MRATRSEPTRQEFEKQSADLRRLVKSFARDIEDVPGGESLVHRVSFNPGLYELMRGLGIQEDRARMLAFERADYFSARRAHKILHSRGMLCGNRWCLGCASITSALAASFSLSHDDEFADCRPVAP